MADFDINALLQNPLFLGGISGLLANPNDRAAALLGGIRTGSQLQTADQERQINALKLKALQAQQSFDPSQYMKTAPVTEGSATPNALQAQYGNQMPATLGGPIGGQTQMPNQMTMTPGGISFEPGTPTGRVDMQGLLSGGMQAGLTPQQIMQIAAIQDPQTAAEQAAAAKLAEPYTLGPAQQRIVGNTVIASNNNPPPGGLAQTLMTLQAQRDALPEGSPMRAMLDTAIRKQSGQLDEAQFQQRQGDLQANREYMHQNQQNQQQYQHDQKVVTQAGQFSNQLQKIGVPQAQQQLDNIDSILAKHANSENKVPGYGVVQGTLPNWAVSKDAQELRQSVQSLANVILKMRSGAAVTDPEMKRFVTELGTGTWMPEDRLLQGLSQMRSLLESEKRNAAAGVSNDVLDAYSSTPGGIDFTGYKKQGSGPMSGGGSSTSMDAVAAEMKRRGLK